MSITATDLFAGLGGSSTGLVEAGVTVKLAANHWDVAVASHQANHPETEHLTADISNFDMRRLPKTDMLWASPICTEVSPANGSSKKASAKHVALGQTQLEIEQETGSHVPKKGLERTRATAFDVVRATEVHRYAVVIVENVPNFVTKWELFDCWLRCMMTLGYDAQIVSGNSAHLSGENNPGAPQWRDRIYVVFTRKGIRRPDLRIRPEAFCFVCEQKVKGIQSWKDAKRNRKVGSYGQQYVFRCPNRKCGHALVEPYVRPALDAIDMSNLGIRIGDRAQHKLRPLVPATLRRIKVGIKMFGGPTVVTAAGNTFERPGSDYVRAWPAGSSPLMTRTQTAGDGVANPPVLVKVNHDDGENRGFRTDVAPLSSRTTKIGDGLVMGRTQFVTELRGGGSAARAITDPLATVTTARHHAVTTVPEGAFVMKHHGGLDYKRPEHMVKSPYEPLGTVVNKPNVSLVIPFRRGAKPHGTDRPLSTVATHATHGLASMDISDISDDELDDVMFRMLGWREHASAQRLPGDYKVEGTSGEKTAQAGNAVSVNAAHWITVRVLPVLDAL